MNYALKTALSAAGLVGIIYAAATLTPRRAPQPKPVQSIHRTSIPLKEALSLYIAYPHERHAIQRGDQLYACARNEGLKPPYIEAYVVYVENLPANRDSVQTPDGTYVKKILSRRKLNYDPAQPLHLQLPDINGGGVNCQYKRAAQ